MYNMSPPYAISESNATLERLCVALHKLPKRNHTKRLLAKKNYYYPQSKVSISLRLKHQLASDEGVKSGNES